MPQLDAVVVGSVEVERDMVVVTARTRAGPVGCSGCGQRSSWEHSRYVGRLGDEAVGGRAVRIDLSVRRLYCENTGCPKVTCVEQVCGLTVRYQRRTPALQLVVEAVAVALAGSAGARLLVHLHQRVSWSTLLRCVMKLPDPPAAVTRVLGVDDFALLRGQSYGTILVDTLTRLPLEVWEGRTAEALAVWLRAHPGVQVVCRDGSEVYRAGITAGAPEAVQVSDRFHLWQGLTRRVRDTVAAHRACLTPLVPPPPGTVPTAGPDPGTVAHSAVLVPHQATFALVSPWSQARRLVGCTLICASRIRPRCLTRWWSRRGSGRFATARTRVRRGGPALRQERAGRPAGLPGERPVPVPCSLRPPDRAPGTVRPGVRTVEGPGRDRFLPFWHWPGSGKA